MKSNQNVPFEKKNQPFHSNQIASFVQFVIDSWHKVSDRERDGEREEDRGQIVLMMGAFCQHLPHHLRSLLHNNFPKTNLPQFIFYVKHLDYLK